MLSIGKLAAGGEDYYLEGDRRSRFDPGPRLGALGQDDRVGATFTRSSWSHGTAGAEWTAGVSRGAS